MEELVVTCPRCRAAIPEVAHFCQRCGQDMRSPDSARRRRFAVKPDEPVASFAILSTIMPHGVTQRPTTYRLALVAALTIALVAAIFGALPVAIVVAVVAIPLVYIVYLYDVNLWDDQPVRVTALAFGLTFVVALLFTLAWTQLFNPQPLDGGLQPVPLLVWALLVPVVGEAIRQVGPLVLASRPRFDDLMDGLTFGVVSGVAYSAAETLVLYWPTLIGGAVEGDATGAWVALIFLQGFVKPLILGTATGIAAAEFSGLGRRYDGFTPRYFRGLAQALGAVIAFYLGIHLLGLIPEVTTSAFLSVIWGMLVLGLLVILVRNVLHTGLMEAALESAARGAGVGEDGELDFCAQCEMPLLGGAAFCTACGAAVRMQRTKPHRDRAGGHADHSGGHADHSGGPVFAGTGTGTGAGAGVAVAERVAVATPTEPLASPPQPLASPAVPETAPSVTADPLDRGHWSDGDADESLDRWDADGPADDDNDRKDSAS